VDSISCSMVGGRGGGMVAAFVVSGMNKRRQRRDGRGRVGEVVVGHKIVCWCSDNEGNI